MRSVRLMPASAIIAEEAGTLLHDVERLFNRSGLNPADKFALANVRMALRRVRDRHRQCMGVDMPDAAPVRANYKPVRHDAPVVALPLLETCND